MKKETGRDISLSELQFKRKEVIRHYKAGMAIMQIVKTVNLCWASVRKTIDKYEDEGISGIKLSKPGRKKGSGRKLNPEQEKHIQKIIRDKNPDQIKMNFALWNRRAVSLLIEREFKIIIPIRSVGRYLKLWGFTPQKPILKAYQQNPKAVEKWLNEEYPSIVSKSKVEDAEIQWADETSLMSNDVRGRSYSPKGITPVAYTGGIKKRQFSMISSITNQGKAQWMIIEGSFNSERFIEFLEKLIKDSTKKIFLVVDNLRVHHSKPVKEWLENQKEKIELFFLPSYSPELNPDERLNADLKYSIGSMRCAKTAEHLKENTTNHMNMICNNSERVKTYFMDKYTKYAAAN